MTLKSWREEFMPKMPTKKLTKIEAIEHSLRKWRGVTKSNLKKHDLMKVNYWIKSTSLSILDIDSSTCALCKKYYDDDADLDDRCNECPLFQTLGYKCDSKRNTAPYNIWIDDGNPLPMIRALEKTLKREMVGEIKDEIR